MSDKCITLITYQFSVVVKGIENKLVELGYKVDVVSDTFDILPAVSKTSDLFLIYLPSDIADSSAKISALSLMCDTAKDAGINIILLGEYLCHEDLSKAYPRIDNYEWVDRPVDMDKFGPIVKKAIEKRPDQDEKKRILIVDDDPAYAKMIREWIKDSYKVDIVTAGMQAIKFLLKVKENEQVDLILLDYEMPVVDGPQVLQMLRQEPATANIPVVFLTGIGTKEAVSRVMALKPTGYILKSTTREGLLVFLHEKLK
ncbi:MAG: response regulator [Lachnospiraceae bacterium]|nr:response regulator [Lachnospiraceae bacterium]